MFAYVGSFTTAQRNARGDGIHAYGVDGANGTWTHLQHVKDLVELVEHAEQTGDIVFAHLRRVECGICFAHHVKESGLSLGGVQVVFER